MIYWPDEPPHYAPGSEDYEYDAWRQRRDEQEAERDAAVEVVREELYANGVTFHPEWLALKMERRRLEKQLSAVLESLEPIWKPEKA